MQVLNSLYSGGQLKLLDIVDDLRAQGLNTILPLPQLIVCGDQSSGKSSVLEAISGVQFPKKENLCTCFATEVILRREGKSRSINVSINASQDRPEEERKKLESFARKLDDIHELPSIMDEAKNLMGLGADAKAFSADVLRLEVTGADVPQLTIVDLPGLIHSETKKQSTEDVELISKLVEGYMGQSRSIILAVISAKNDYANQIILKRARKVDPDGLRTLGIITKPDKLNDKSEGEKNFMDLARNLDIKFKLGWHVVRNIDTSEQDHGKLDRDSVEQDFFQKSNWKALDPATLGILTLRERLSEVLFNQIRIELPSLISDIEAEEASCHGTLKEMGKSRQTKEDQRDYLVEVKQDFYRLVKAGINGDYDDPAFGGSLRKPGVPLLRAIVQNTSTDFEEIMRNRGSGGGPLPYSESDGREDAVDRVVELIRHSRGRELPGTFNPLLIGEVFRDFSCKWDELGQEYLEDLWKRSSNFIRSVTRTVVDESVATQLGRRILNQALKDILEKAKARLGTLLKEVRYHPITYNHYFTDTAAKLQNDRHTKQWKRQMRASLESIFSEHPTFHKSNIEYMISKLTFGPEPDMNRAAAETTLDYALAYYKTARKRFTDDMAVQVIETEILTPLPSLLSPLGTAKMSTAELEAIAGESERKTERRKALVARQTMLRACLSKIQMQTDIKAFGTDSEDADLGTDAVHSRGGDALEEPESERIEDSIPTANAPVVQDEQSEPGLEEVVDPPMREEGEDPFGRAVS